LAVAIFATANFFLPILAKRSSCLAKAKRIIRGCRIKVKMHKEQLSQIFNKKPSPAGEGGPLAVDEVFS